MKARNILVICPNRHLLADLAPLISQHLPLTPVTEMPAYPERGSLAEMMLNTPPTLCFLDMGSDREIGIGVLVELARLSPSTQVVVILDSNDPDLILRCLRQGATEFLLQPLTGEQLHPVLERLSQLSATHSGGASAGGAQTVCVIPVKGACGASTIASSLALQWKRLGVKKNLLADLDPSTGTISFLLNLKPNYSFLDALSRAGTLDTDLWKGLVINFQGVDVLLSPENPMDSTLELPDPTSVIDFCRQAYEVVTIDLGSAYGQWALAVGASCDDVLLVTTNELPALRATQRVLQNFERNRLDRSRLRLVVNRYSPDVGLNQDAIETALQTEVFHVVPSDYEAVQKALVEGKPIASASSFGKSLMALSDKLAGKQAASRASKNTGSAWGSLFASLVSRVTPS